MRPLWPWLTLSIKNLNGSLTIGRKFFILPTEWLLYFWVKNSEKNDIHKREPRIGIDTFYECLVVDFCQKFCLKIQDLFSKIFRNFRPWNLLWRNFEIFFHYLNMRKSSGDFEWTNDTYVLKSTFSQFWEFTKYNWSNQMGVPYLEADCNSVIRWLVRCSFNEQKNWILFS